MACSETAQRHCRIAAIAVCAALLFAGQLHAQATDTEAATDMAVPDSNGKTADSAVQDAAVAEPHGGSQGQLPACGVVAREGRTVASWGKCTRPRE